MSDLRLTCPPGRTPPAEWISGATVSYRGSWWVVREMHADTQGTTGWHFELDRAAPKPTGLGSFDRSEDPGWAEGEVVPGPGGRSYRVAKIARTFGQVGYYGVAEPPDDPPELTDCFL